MAPKSRVAPARGPGGGGGGRGGGGGGRGGKSKKPARGRGAGSRMERLEEAQARFEAGKARREAREEKRKSKLRQRKQAGPFDALLRLLTGRKEVQLNAKSAAMARALMLTSEDIYGIKASYDLVDVDGAGEMDFDEFFEMLGEPRTPFTDAIFTLIDNVENTGIEAISAKERKEMELEDGPGTALHVRGFLTFNDYFQVVCTFAMYGEDDLLLFGFNAFDQENTGVIDENEFMALCLIVNNDAPRYPDNFKLALATFDKNTGAFCGAVVVHKRGRRRRAEHLRGRGHCFAGFSAIHPPAQPSFFSLACSFAPSPDGMMDFNQFKTCHQRFPLTLFPAFRFQDRIRAKVLGPSTWIDVSRRIEVEKKRETYRRAHDGQEMPLTPLEQLCALFSRKREEGVRVKKPTSMAETAEKKAALTANKQADTKVVKGADTLRREGRGAKSVGIVKTGMLQKRTPKGVGGGGF